MRPGRSNDDGRDEAPEVPVRKMAPLRRPDEKPRPSGPRGGEGGGGRGSEFRGGRLLIWLLFAVTLILILQFGPGFR